jgi:hypothetical protein
MSGLVSAGLASLLVLLAVPVAGGTDPCALIPQAEAAKLLGVAVTGARSSGPATDEESGGMLSTCVFRTGSAAVALTYVEFASAKEASAWYRATLTEAQGTAGTKVSPDQNGSLPAFWATTQIAAAYTLAQARYVVAVGGGGPGFHLVSGQSIRLLALEAAKRLQP